MTISTKIIGVWIITLCSLILITLLAVRWLSELHDEQNRNEAEMRLEQEARQLDEDWKQGKGVFSHTTLLLDYDRALPNRKATQNRTPQ